MGSGALNGKMLLVRIIENDKIDTYLGQVRLGKRLAGEGTDYDRAQKVYRFSG